MLDSLDMAAAVRKRPKLWRKGFLALLAVCLTPMYAHAHNPVAMLAAGGTSAVIAAITAAGAKVILGRLLGSVLGRQKASKYISVAAWEVFLVGVSFLFVLWLDYHVPPETLFWAATYASYSVAAGMINVLLFVPPGQRLNARTIPPKFFFFGWLIAMITPAILHPLGAILVGPLYLLFGG